MEKKTMMDVMRNTEEKIANVISESELPLENILIILEKMESNVNNIILQQYNEMLKKQIEDKPEKTKIEVFGGGVVEEMEVESPK